MNSITKPGFQTMSSLASISRRSCLGPAAFCAAIGLMTSAAFAGSVNHGTFAGTKVTYANVTESGVDIPPSLFVPATPVVTNVPDSQLSFSPQQFVQTDQSLVFDLKSKSSQLNIDIIGNALPSDPDYLGYALTGARFNIAGTYSVWAPFGAGDLSPVFPGASIAKVTMTGDYTVQVTGVDWAPYSGGSAVGGSMPIVPSDVTVTGPQNAATNGTWSGSTTIDWAALRTAAGLSPTANITKIAFQYTAVIGAASVYGFAQTAVTNFNVVDTTAMVPVPVPEPPTIILAGLGAAAAAGHGYRRRKLRQRDGEGSDGEWNAGEGAIALTA
jgi:hypothetical protein